MALELTYLLVRLQTQRGVGVGFGVRQLRFRRCSSPWRVHLREVLRRAGLFSSGTGHSIFAFILRKGKQRAVSRDYEGAWHSTGFLVLALQWEVLT